MNAKKNSNLFSFQRYVGIGVTILGIFVIIGDRSAGATVPLMVGLFTLFTSRERVEDERSVSIKTSSLYFALVIAYTIKLLSSYFYSEGLIHWQITEVDYFIILLFSLALVIYYFRLYFGK
ncbi:hypothetical protein [Sphingobacterium sp. SYP-B4668]|uniref:hypothetical protein n=1 Tax=Sphingobacterium sp. SYP-B4668 TaxID=2996035 RepID=UPI0022DD85B5|nr:hypothetical protein [Sphingobacterium sp. SYP-B4668]